MFPCPDKCTAETKVLKTRRQAWRKKGTLRTILCLNPKCRKKFQTVEVSFDLIESTIRQEAERRAREMLEIYKSVMDTDAQKQPPVPGRFTSPRLPVYKE